MEWFPIETARKPNAGDLGFGERVLLCVDCGADTLKSVRIGWWCGQWMLDSGGSLKENGYRATHWQKMPQTPED